MFPCFEWKKNFKKWSPKLTHGTEHYYLKAHHFSPIVCDDMILHQLKRSKIIKACLNSVYMESNISGFVSCTMTNPIWFVKTRLQLDGQTVTALQCIKRIYAKTVIYFRIHTLFFIMNICTHYFPCYYIYV